MGTAFLSLHASRCEDSVEIDVKKKFEFTGAKLYDLSTSWFAIIFFGVLCIGWATFNSFQFTSAYHFDPYPFNNLRLLLSFIGAIQAPLLLTYSRKSTEYRKELLQKDYTVAKKTLRKVKWIKKQLKEMNDG
jgi:uncharacterized membrane protein